jgi:acetolactate synthase-1/2/3 large subunit
MLSKTEWVNKCNYWKEKWPLFINDYLNDDDGINLYTIIEAINKISNEKDVLLTDAGTAYYVCGQNLQLKKDQIFIYPAAQADMGFCVPACVGAQLANPNHNIVAIVGDGSFQTNIQELASIRAINSNSKIIILNNQGYLSIRNTQSKFFNDNLYGESESTGLWFPDLKKISSAYDFDYFQINNNDELLNILSENLHNHRPIIFDIKCKFVQEVIPTTALKIDQNTKQKIQCGLDDMYPFLSEEEHESEMIK